MTTIVEGEQMLTHETDLYRVSEKIRGGDAGNPHPGMPDHFDTSRQVALYTSEGSLQPKGVIYLHAMNTNDHAVCVLDHKKKPDGLPDIRVSVDDVLQEDLSNWAENEGLWRIPAGQTFRVWMGGAAFDERDEHYGYATVTWMEPVAE